VPPAAGASPGVAVSGDDGTPRPLLRVVSGEPTPEELAALLVVVTARSGASVEPAGPEPPSPWTSRRALLRRPLHPGPGAWRASALPGH
jgi:hypothetical protein